jgi:hypothetical protein
MPARSELITLFREFVADDDPDLKLRFWRHVVAGAARCEHRLSSRARRTTASIFAATLVSCPELFRRIAARAFHGDPVWRRLLCQYLYFCTSKASKLCVQKLFFPPGGGGGGGGGGVLVVVSAGVLPRGAGVVELAVGAAGWGVVSRSGGGGVGSVSAVEEPAVTPGVAGVAVAGVAGAGVVVEEAAGVGVVVEGGGGVGVELEDVVGVGAHKAGGPR